MMRLIKHSFQFAQKNLEHVALVIILLISILLNSFRLNQVGINGFGNPYYAAGVQSMLKNWHNFFYLAFDPAGFLALDKAPLALWIQAASAKLFGFNGLSLLLPQTIAGVLSVFVLYKVVRRAYGKLAGLSAAFTLTVMPINVVTNRTNFPDAWLIFTLLLAAWAIALSVENNSLRWLLAGAVLAGVAFNIKMLQIVLVVPALGALFLFGSTLPWPQRLKQAGMALFVMMIVAVPWITAVELTPPTHRPYIGGSTTNSIFELTFGYNGIDRLWGEDFTYFLGQPGLLRLFNEKLAGQISWLLPFALIGLIVTIRQARQGRSMSSRQHQALILWTVWLVPQLVYFSISLFYHRYYLATAAPAIAALVGISAKTFLSMAQSANKQKWWFAGALILNGLIQAFILLRYPAWGWWLIPAILGGCFVGIMALIWFTRYKSAHNQIWIPRIFFITTLILYIAPIVWTIIPVVTCTDMTLPIAGPQPRECQPFAVKPFLDQSLIDYLKHNHNDAKFMAATYDLGIAEMGILETEEPFMALGGYRGRDPILTAAQFSQFVAEGKVRYFLRLEDPGEQWPQQEAILEWVETNCPISPIEVEGIEVRGPCKCSVVPALFSRGLREVFR